MDELIFTGVDIPEKVKEINTQVTSRVVSVMEENEARAYKLGVMNTLSVLRGLVDSDCTAVVHIPDLEDEVEFTFDELERFWFENI